MMIDSKNRSAFEIFFGEGHAKATSRHDDAGLRFSHHDDGGPRFPHNNEIQFQDANTSQKCRKNQNIFLVGPMGVGKTGIGKWIARFSNRQFIDSDQVIEQEAGVSISWIFDVEQEAGFRAREARVIQRLVMEQGIVLATGGGCVLTPSNRKALMEHGVVVFLTADINVLCQRVMAQPNTRPLLARASDLEVRIQTIFSERSPLFESMATLTVDTSTGSLTTLAKQIIKAVDG